MVVVWVDDFYVGYVGGSVCVFGDQVGDVGGVVEFDIGFFVFFGQVGGEFEDVV